MNTITLPRSVVEQALKALEKADRISGYRNNWAEVNSLIAALEQPQGQEPIGWVTGYYGGRCTVAPRNGATVLPVGMALYTHPQPKREPLTEMEINTIWRNSTHRTTVEVVRAIEAAHGIGGEA